MTAAEYRKELRRIIDKKFGGSIRAAGKAWGTHPANVYKVLSGSIPAYGQLIQGSGFRKVVSFERAS